MMLTSRELNGKLQRYAKQLYELEREKFYSLLEDNWDGRKLRQAIHASSAAVANELATVEGILAAVEEPKQGPAVDFLMRYVSNTSPCYIGPEQRIDQLKVHLGLPLSYRPPSIGPAVEYLKIRRQTRLRLKQRVRTNLSRVLGTSRLSDALVHSAMAKVDNMFKRIGAVKSYKEYDDRVEEICAEVLEDDFGYSPEIAHRIINDTVKLDSNGDILVGDFVLTKLY